VIADTVAGMISLVLVILGQLDGVAPKELAEGLSQSLPVALAWCCVVLLLMLIASNVFWVRAYLKQTEDRIAALWEYSQQQNANLTSVVTLGMKQAEGLEIVDKVMDHVSQQRQSPN
jgi:hypothetical protein